MMKWIKENDIILRVSSLLLAVLLWAYAMSNDQSDVKQPFRDLPVQLEGVNILKEQDLVILSGADSTVSVELMGKREQISTAMNDPLTIIKRVVSVASITEPGTYELGIQADTVGLDGTSVVSKTPAAITLVVDRMSTTAVPVEVELTGALGSGLSLAECTPSPDAIIVRGPETVLRQIKKAKVSYDISSLTSALQTNVTYTLLDEAGNEVTNSYLSADTPSTTLNFELRQEGAVTVTVKLLDSPYLKSYMVKADIEPESVILKGDPEVIEGINQIVLPDIDLNEVVENKTTEFTRLLLLPDGASLVKGQKPFAVVKLTLDGYGWQTVNLNQTNLPEDPLFLYPEQTFSVELFGEESTLRRIRDDDMVLELTYDLEELVVGQNVLPCVVKLEEEGIYIEQDLEITVEVTQEALDAARTPQPDDPNAPQDPDEPTVEPEE